MNKKLTWFLQAQRAAASVGNWILATAFWNDSGVWVDGANWID